MVLEHLPSLITVGVLRDVRLWRRAKMDAQIGVGKERL
jgi:hypothetical protein